MAVSEWKTEVGDPESDAFADDDVILSQPEIEAIYAGIERAACCEQFVDRMAGCSEGEKNCNCFAIGARIVEALRPAQAPTDPKCLECGDGGQVFAHADDCRNDSCALAGGIDDCNGQVVPCSCPAGADIADGDAASDLPPGATILSI